MVVLTYREILAELNKLGINTFDELMDHLREYKLYYAPQKNVIIENLESASEEREQRKISS